MGHKPDLLQHVAMRIRELRQAYNAGEGISQEALANAIGVTANTVSRWETSVYKPKLEDLDALSRFFGVSILEFFPREDVPENEQVAALLRTARDLAPDDIEELSKYAEFRRARSLYSGGGRPRPGRRAKAEA